MSVREQLAPNVARDDQLAERARGATRVLREVVDDTGGDVEAAWDLDADAQGRPVVRLRLSDFTERAETTFAPDELAAPGHLRRRLHWLWGNLLQDRARRQINEAMALGTAGEG
jgi:hypothetical protein